MAKTKKKKLQVNSKQEKYIYYFWLVFIALVPPLGTYGIKLGYSPDLHMGSLIQIGGLLVLMASFMFFKVTILLNKQFLAILLMYLYMVISVLWVINPYESSMRLLDWGGGLIAIITIYLFFHQFLKNYKHLSNAYFILMLSGALATLLALAQYWFGYRELPQAVVPGSFFSNKNMAAQYILLSLPLVIHFWLQFKDKKNARGFYLTSALIVAMITVIMYTFASAAWVSLGVQIILFFVIAHYYIKRHNPNFLDKKLVIAITVMIIAVLVLLPIPKKGQSSTGYKAFIAETDALVKQVDADVRSTNIRIAIWSNSMAMLKDNWFKGIGAGNWVVVYPYYHQKVRIDRQMSVSVKHDNAHNDYIEILTEFGIFGLLFFGYFLFYTFKRILLVLKNGNYQDNLFILVPALSLAGILVDACFSFPLQQPVPILWVFILSSIAIIISHKVEPLNEVIIDNYTKSIKYTKYFVIFGLIFASIFLFNLHKRWYQSEIYKRIAIIEAGKGNFSKVAHFGKLAYNLKPEHKELAHAYAVGLRESKKYKEADKYFDITMSQYPYTLTYLSNTINNSLNLRNFDKAIELLETYTKIRKNDYAMTRLLGVILVNEKQDYPNGFKYMRKAIALDPNRQESKQLQQFMDSIFQQAKQKR